MGWPFRFLSRLPGYIINVMLTNRYCVGDAEYKGKHYPPGPPRAHCQPRLVRPCPRRAVQANLCAWDESTRQTAASIRSQASHAAPGAAHQCEGHRPQAVGTTETLPTTSVGSMTSQWSVLWKPRPPWDAACTRCQTPLTGGTTHVVCLARADIPTPTQPVAC